jgi:hypothetical protein
VIPYEVFDTDTGESHGQFETWGEVVGCLEYDRIRAWNIWQGDDLVDSFDLDAEPRANHH